MFRDSNLRLDTGVCGTEKKKIKKKKKEKEKEEGERERVFLFFIYLIALHNLKHKPRLGHAGPLPVMYSPN
jgi:hypothetical protein